MKRLLSMLLLAFFCFSCNSEKKAQRKAEAFYSQYPAKLAEQCLEKFPIKDSIIEKTDTVISKSDNKDYSSTLDSLSNLIDSFTTAAPKIVSDSNCINAYNQILKQQTILKQKLVKIQNDYKPCIPDTFRLSSVVRVTDPYAVAVWKYRADSLGTVLIATKTKLEVKEDTIKRDTWIIIILSAAVAVGVYFKIRKII